MIKKILNKLLGDPSVKALKKIYPIVKKINEIEEKYQNEIKDQNDVLAKTTEFKERIKQGESVDSIMPEAFGVFHPF